jgi:nucleoside-diphosphate-sugar epimerase
MIKKNDKIVITGAAGLVGQNLILLLQEQGYKNIVALDKHGYNLNILRQLNPKVIAVFSDLAESGNWQSHFEDAACAIVLHAQITSTSSAEFLRNNLTATQHVIDAIHQYKVPYTIHISSSVVNSVADDDYTNTKRQQEKIIAANGINYCILRPTLMFGWFDRKHFGWLSRFMKHSPVFPIPGHGRYMRQPLYGRDFCKVIIAALEQQPAQQTYDIVGSANVYYIDMIRKIRNTRKLKTWIVKIPYQLFYVLLKLAALISRKPPFTAEQLTALTAGDYFTGIDADKTFGVKMTDFDVALHETFNHPQYSQIVLER